ncbi:MAG: hypothetical protein EZS28_000814 [Streblomastix strix]|uniref:Uncharacterized protein n=1 Tax=Streblomastix strix TaxID=222440 RepID=A0A5J4XA58_9EUKA|nr:MAG: hypothetical protein EZS28_000814 [Streblomastix strix]
MQANATSLPSLVADLSSVDETVRLKALYNILDEIGTAKIECCRASQFSSLLAQLYLLMRDFFKVEELEQIAEILELLSTKITVMTDEEANKFIYIFKAKQIGYLMKIKFLDPSIPKSVKESLAYSISAFGLIDDYYDFIFNPILKFLMEKLKIMEELLNKQPYKKELDPKRSKYGFRTLATILNALCIFTFGNYGLKSQIASHGGIEIGMRYMNHQSNKIRVIAATLFGLSSDKSIGIDFRTKNNFIDLLNKYIPQPHHIKVSSTHSHLISPRVRMKNLHSGLISGFGLLNTFRSEENQIRIQKTFTLMQQEKQDENEDAYFAQKRVIEDLEQEGLIETVQSMFFSTDERQTRTQSLFKTIIFQNY